MRSIKFTKKTALMAAAVPVVAALATGAVGVASASAVTTGTYKVSGVNIRTCASTSCASLGEGQPGQVAYVYCYTGPLGEPSEQWVYNADHTTGVGSGYSGFSYLTWKGTITHC